MKNKFYFITLIIFITLLTAQIVHAAYDPNRGVAMSVGTDYSGFWPWQADIDTTQDAINAQTAFASMYYNSYYQNIPTYQYLRGNNPYTGKPRMESKVLFFSGHGNNQSMTYNYKQQGGDNKTGIWWGYNWDSSSSGYKYAGIYSYNMNNVRLAIFGGCQTALGQDNLAKRANTSGVGTSMGWSVSIGASSHSQWFNNFFVELKKSGRTVQTAVNYANGFSYSDNGVKNVVIYGNTQYVPTWDSDIYKATNILDIEKIEYIPNYKLKNSYEDKELKDFLNYFIKENINKNFNIDDYSYEINGTNITKYYDLNYLYNGAKTSSSYTIIVENDIVIKIIDNTKTFDQIENKNMITDSDRKQNLLDIKNEVLKQNKNYEIVSQKDEVIYDINDGKYKILSFTEIKDIETQTFYVLENIR